PRRRAPLVPRRGLLVWAQLVNPAHRHRLGPSQRLGFMVAMFAFALALGGILVATPPLYPAYAEQSVRLFGISPALDQRLAGLVMIGEQVASLALCFAFLLPALGSVCKLGAGCWVWR